MSVNQVCDLETGTIDESNLRKISFEIDEKYKRSKVYGGEILVSVVGTIGRAVIVPEKLAGANIARAIARIKVNNLISTTWVLNWLKSHEMQQWLSHQAREVARKTLNLNLLKTAPIPIPPLNEQRRIVEKIEELKTHTLRSQQALDEIPALIDQFRQSVLAAAFRGDLTADWRKKNSNVEPAEKLLERIREERRQKWEDAKLERMQSQGKKPKDDKWKEQYKEPPICDENILPQIPSTWTWMLVEDFAEVATGATPKRGEKRYYDNGSIPWITSGALNNWNIHDAEEFVTPLAIAETNAKIFPKNTILIAMYGEGRTRGKVSELMIEAATNQACAALVLNGLSSHIRSFVKLFFQKNYDDFRRLASGGVQPNLNLSMIRGTAVPLPPLPEQKEIIQTIEKCMSIFDAVIQQYADNIESLDQLNQSILAKAFRGELVPQDPNDEPASALLDRIRAEREKLGTTKTQKRSSRKRSQ